MYIVDNLCCLPQPSYTMLVILERAFCRFLPVVACLSLCYACAPYKVPTQTFIESSLNCQNGAAQGSCPPKVCRVCTQQAAACHWLYAIVPRHRSQIEWYDLGHWSTWLLFGNDDEGIFGEISSANYKPNKPIMATKALFWWCRNPLHNLCGYVIGSAYQTNSHFTLLRFGQGRMCFCHKCQGGGRVFGGKSTSFYLALHGCKPFVSLRLAYGTEYTSDFYFGWRERGNFGIKCIFLHRTPFEN